MEFPDQNNEFPNGDLKAALRSIERDKLAEAVDDWESKIPATSKSTGKILQMVATYKYGVAAALVTLIAVLQFFPRSNTDINSLANSYFEPYPNVTYPIARSTDEESLLHVMSIYEDGDYTTAADGLRQYCNQQQYATTCFYLAMCNIQSNDLDEAINNLTTIKNSNADPLNDKVDWYLAISYIKKKDLSSAKTQLEKVITNKSFNHKLAQQLLDRIK